MKEEVEKEIEVWELGTYSRERISIEDLEKFLNRVKSRGATAP